MTRRPIARAWANAGPMKELDASSRPPNHSRAVPCQLYIALFSSMALNVASRVG